MENTNSNRIPGLFTFLLLPVLVACGGSEHSADSDQTWSEGTSGSDTSAGGSGAGSTAPACADEGAGHTAEAATPLALGDLSGCVAAEPDVFSFRATRHPAGTLFQLEVSSGGGALTVTLLDAEQRTLKEAAVAAGREAALYVVVATETSVFARITGPQTVSAYTVALAATPLTDESEPNDTREDAQPLNMGRVLSGLLQSAANNEAVGTDFYQVLVAQTGSLEVVVEPGSDALSLDVELLSASGEQLERSAAENRGAAVTVESRVRRGTYFIKVVDAGDSPERAAGAGDVPRFLTEPYTIVANTR